MPSMTETITVHLTPDAFAEVAKALAAHHKQLKEEDARLILRHGLSDLKDIHLLEVLGKFPGAPGEKFSTYKFDPTKDLMIPGKYHFTLVSPAQMDQAIAERHPFLLAIAAEAASLSSQV